MIAGLLFWISTAGILYIYLGYPLLVTLLARARPKPAAVHEPLPGISLIICAYNEEAVIAQKIENTLALDYPPGQMQILIVADGSDDRTAEIAGEYAARGVEVLFEPERRGKLAAVNRGAAAARNDILVFSDANNLYDRNALKELVRPFADPGIGAVSGAKVILKGDGSLGDSEGLYWKYESFIKRQETRLGSCIGVCGEILAVRRNLFRPVPKTVINDDFFIAVSVLRQGSRVAYAPEARSYERVSLSAMDEVTRRARIVAGRYQAMFLMFSALPWRKPVTVWQIISHKFLRPLVPFLMIAAFLANLAAVLWPPPAGPAGWLRLAVPFNWVLLGGQLTFYLLAALGDAFIPNKGIGKLFYLPKFLVNSNLAAVYGLIRYASGKQTAVWKRVSRRSGETARGS